MRYRNAIQDSVYAKQSLMAIRSLVFTFAQKAQQINEEIGDVEIEVDCSYDVIFRRNFLHDHLSVVNDVHREEYGSSSSNHRAK